MLTNKQRLIKELETKLDNFRKMYTERGTELSKIEKDSAILGLFESGDFNEIDLGTDLDNIPSIPYFPNPSKPPYYNPVVTVYGCPAIDGTGLPIDYFVNITSAVKEDSNEEESKQR